MAQAVLLDVDGTLVDANFHHALAWYRAFRSHGIGLPMWRIHRHIGMGGDQLVPALVPGIKNDLQEGIEAKRGEFYAELIDEVQPFEEAHELIADLRERGLTVVLASSSPQNELDHYLDLLRARTLLDAWTTKDDVDATKPDPDLVVAALEKAGSRDAVMVGDTPWDVEAARKAALDTICLITGGWSRHELLEAGAVAVYESIVELRQDLDGSPLSLS
ncbi:MAG TPA: HAD family hydrolase [Gaiellaceae bacterium]|nr:HAD family hydrolase [Gaiellaceae bacterium]